MSPRGPLRLLPWWRHAAWLGASLGIAAVALAACGDPRGRGEGGGAGGSREVVFTESCDASAAVPLDHRLMAVADDEDSILRVYDVDQGGAPIRSVDLSAGLFPPGEREKGRAEKKKKKKKRKTGPGGPSEPPRPRRAPESDIEAAVRVGDVAYWMTSHGRNRAGKRKDARQLFFATTARDADDALVLLGRSYELLLDDLLADERYAPFDLAGASRLAPKDEGGLNLEGLGLRPQGGVWLGFRNPIPGGKALLAALLNPERLIEGERARLGEPLLLDLGGLGIRELSSWRGRTLILAGPYAQGDGSRLFSWDGRGAPLELPGIDLSDFRPEAFFAPEGRDEILLLSDDGTVEIDGKECKRLDDPDRKRFRGRWIRLPSPTALGEVGGGVGAELPGRPASG